MSDLHISKKKKTEDYRVSNGKAELVWPGGEDYLADRCKKLAMRCMKAVNFNLTFYEGSDVSKANWFKVFPCMQMTGWPDAWRLLYGLSINIYKDCEVKYNGSEFLHDFLPLALAMIREIVQTYRVPVLNTKHFTVLLLGALLHAHALEEDTPFSAGAFCNMLTHSCVYISKRTVRGLQFEFLRAAGVMVGSPDAEAFELPIKESIKKEYKLINRELNISSVGCLLPGYVGVDPETGASVPLNEKIYPKPNVICAIHEDSRIEEVAYFTQLIAQEEEEVEEEEEKEEKETSDMIDIE